MTNMRDHDHGLAIDEPARPTLDQLQRWAAILNTGPQVTLSREVANLIENFLITALSSGARARVWPGREQTIHALRYALSQAIEETDRRRNDQG